jgi:hypothetical protein
MFDWYFNKKKLPKELPTFSLRSTCVLYEDLSNHNQTSPTPIPPFLLGLLAWEISYTIKPIQEHGVPF